MNLKKNNLNIYIINNNSVVYMKKKSSCLNCQSFSHSYKECTESIKSWGIIAIFNNKVLMVQRKHTLGFTDFIRGIYNEKNHNNILLLFKQMSQIEINKLSSLSFADIWKEVYPNSNLASKEYLYASNKYDFIKNNSDINLNYYLDNIIYSNEPEWGFPKGRKKYNERDIDCAKREFVEETNIPLNNIDINEYNVYYEKIIGTNGKSYEHIYYIGYLKSDVSLKLDNNLEIGDIGLFSLDHALKLIKHYHDKRKEILKLILT